MAADETPRLKLPFMSTAQVQKELTFNELAAMVDALLHPNILDKDLNAPPASPAEGATYIIGPAPTGAWAGKTKSLAIWIGGWHYIAPSDGWLMWVSDESKFYRYKTADGWQQTLITPAEYLAELTDVNAGTPGEAQDGYALAWDQATGKYTLQPVAQALADLSDIDLTDIETGQGLIWDGEKLVPGDINSLKFIELTDVPEAYVAGKALRVNEDGDALEFYTPSDVVSDFLGLSDTPDDFGEMAGKILAVAPEENRLIFIDPPTGGGGGSGLPTGGAQGQFLAKASSTDGDAVWVDPPTGGGDGGGTPELPSISGNAGKVLKVNPGATAVIWAEDIVGEGGGGGAIDQVAAPYWRIRFTESGAGRIDVAVQELEFWAGGVKIPTVGVAIGSSQYDNEWTIPKAFDGDKTNGSNVWFAQNDQWLNQWIGFHFNTPVAPDTLKVWPWASDTTYSRYKFVAEYSLDGATWTQVGDTMDATADGWAANTSRNFEVPAVAAPSVEEAPADGKLYGRKDGEWEEIVGGGAGGGDIEVYPRSRYWRIFVSLAQNTDLRYNELRFIGSGGQNLAVGGSALGTIGNVANLFDGLLNTYADGGRNTSAGYFFPEEVELRAVTIVQASDVYRDRAPWDFSLQQSVNGVDWIEYQAFSDRTPWPVGQEGRTFPLTPEVQTVTWVEEAPEDGKAYQRKNGTWAEVSTLDGLPEGGGVGNLVTRDTTGDPEWFDPVTEGFANEGILTPYGKHAYWRFVITAAAGNSYYAHVSEMVMRNTPGGPTLTVGGAAISGGNAETGRPPSNAFDGVLAGGNAWICNSQGGNMAVGGAWIGYRFPQPVSIIEVSIFSTAGEISGERATAGRIEYSDDGIGWITAWAIGPLQTATLSNTITSPDYTEIGERKFLAPDGGDTGQVLAKASADGGDFEWVDSASSLPAPMGARRFLAVVDDEYTLVDDPTIVIAYPSYRYWRIKLIENQDPQAFIGITGLEMLDENGVNRSAGGSGAFSLGQDDGSPSRAFMPWANNDAGSGIQKLGKPLVVGYDFGVPREIRTINMTAYRGTERAPKTFTIEGSDDNATYVEVLAVGGQIDWVLGPDGTRTFIIPGVEAGAPVGPAPTDGFAYVSKDGAWVKLVDELALLGYTPG